MSHDAHLDVAGCLADPSLALTAGHVSRLLQNITNLKIVMAGAGSAGW